VHYPSDVLAGFATGFIWLVISIYIVGRIEKFTRRKVKVETQGTADQSVLTQ